MSKIKVLRVPDEQMNSVEVNESYPDGTLIVRGPERTSLIVLPDEKPALLAALLEGAGAVRTDAAGVIASARVSAFGSRFWILPIPEDTP